MDWTRPYSTWGVSFQAPMRYAWKLQRLLLYEDCIMQDAGNWYAFRPDQPVWVRTLFQTSSDLSNFLRLLQKSCRSHVSGSKPAWDCCSSYGRWTWVVFPQLAKSKTLKTTLQAFSLWSCTFFQRASKNIIVPVESKKMSHLNLCHQHIFACAHASETKSGVQAVWASRQVIWKCIANQDCTGAVFDHKPISNWRCWNKLVKSHWPTTIKRLLGGFTVIVCIITVAAALSLNVYNML